MICTALTVLYSQQCCWRFNSPRCDGVLLNK